MPQAGMCVDGGYHNFSMTVTVWNSARWPWRELVSFVFQLNTQHTRKKEKCYGAVSVSKTMAFWGQHKRTGGGGRGGQGTGGVYAVYISYIHILTRAHETEDTSCNIARPPAVTAGKRGLIWAFPNKDISLEWRRALIRCMYYVFYIEFVLF